MTLAKRVRTSAYIVLIDVTRRSGEKQRHGICVAHSKSVVLRLYLPALNVRLQIYRKAHSIIATLPVQSKDISGNRFNSGILFPGY